MMKKKRGGITSMEEQTGSEISEIQQTWKKVETVSRKAGLREGISDGRDGNFQKYFDIGFREGFKNGYALGKYKGTLMAHSRLNSSKLFEYPLLNKIGRGGCEICKNEELLKRDITEIIHTQTESSNKNLKELYSICNNVFKCDILPNKLD